MRCFLGCDLSGNAKMALQSWRDKYSHVQSQNAKPVKPANFHLTTLFLGQVEPRQLEILVRTCESELADMKPGIHPFELVLDDMLVWKKPKIVVATPSSVPAELEQLHSLSRNAVYEAGIKTAVVHDRFRPHVTLTRNVKPEEVPAPLILPNVTTSITHLHLFESVSSASGVQYHSRFSWPLSPALYFKNR